MEAREAPAFETALFGKFASDPLGRQIISTVALWPKSERDLSDHLGNYARIVRWTAKYSGGRRKRFTEARIHPAIDAVLDILIPALCMRDSTPFKLFADAIEATRYADFPRNRKLYAACHVAARLCGEAPAFNEFGEPEAEAALRRELGEPQTEASHNLPVGFSEFMRRTQNFCAKRHLNHVRGADRPGMSLLESRSRSLERPQRKAGAISAGIAKPHLLRASRPVVRPRPQPAGHVRWGYRPGPCASSGDYRRVGLHAVTRGASRRRAGARVAAPGRRLALLASAHGGISGSVCPHATLTCLNQPTPRVRLVCQMGR